jgi:copper resistance protein B
MNLAVALTTGIALTLVTAATPAAENQARHQQHQESPVATEDHTEHTGRSEHAQHTEASQDEPTESERRHVPPDPPQHPLHDMSNERMIELMQMEDDAPLGMVLLDELEWHELDGEDAVHWDAELWYGDDYNKAWFRSEGNRAAGEYEGLAELFWDRIIGRWWHAQVGARQDFGDGPSRTWAAFGIQGLAPYWFEVQATAYVGEEGRTALRFSGEYELFVTQRLILQPKIEFDLYGKDDPRNAIGAGLADSEVGLRLRYEFRRELAPYVGLVWTRSYGNTADFARAAGDDTDDLQFVAGLRVWF